MSWNYGRFLCTLTGFHRKYGEWPSEIHLIPAIYHHIKGSYDSLDWPTVEAHLRFVINNDEHAGRRLTATDGQDRSVDYFLDGLNLNDSAIDPHAWLGAFPSFMKPVHPKFCQECSKEIEAGRCSALGEVSLCYLCKIKQEQRVK